MNTKTVQARDLPFREEMTIYFLGSEHKGVKRVVTTLSSKVGLLFSDNTEVLIPVDTLLKVVEKKKLPTEIGSVIYNVVTNEDPTPHVSMVRVTNSTRDINWVAQTYRLPVFQDSEIVDFDLEKE